MVSFFFHSCIHGNGSHSRRYIYASDVADAVDIILHKGQVGELYNIGTDFEISNIELAHRLIREMGMPQPIDNYIEYVEDRAFNDLRYAIDTSKLQKLGWKPSVNFDKGLSMTSMSCTYAVCSLDFGEHFFTRLGFWYFCLKLIGTRNTALPGGTHAWKAL